MQNPGVQVTMLNTAELPAFLQFQADDFQDPLSGTHPQDSDMAGERGVFPFGGKLYLIHGEKTFCCEDTQEGRELLAAIAGPERTAAPKTSDDAIRLILNGYPEESIPALVKRFRIRAVSPCCMIVLTCKNRNGMDLCKTIRTVCPMEKNDLLTAFSDEMSVLIKQDGDMTEAAEFTLALMDTLEGETGLQLYAGVSDPHDGPEEWAEAFREACSAIRVGAEFRLKGSVQVYRSQMLERLLSEIPAEKRQQYRRMVFNERTKKTLNEETLETVDMFFESDLNLSDTARQMFIHRNTLTYRLDKIRKETGLDLRRFSDSVIFRVLKALPEENG